MFQFYIPKCFGQNNFLGQGANEGEVVVSPSMTTAPVTEYRSFLVVELKVKTTEPAKGHREKKIISCARDGFSCALDNVFFSRCPFAGSVENSSVRALVTAIGCENSSF